VRTSASVTKVGGHEAVVNGEAVTANVIIGADGPRSIVAKSFGLPANKDMYPAVTAFAEGDFEPVMEMHFGSVAPGAYAWVLPKKHGANVGVGVAPRWAKGRISDYFEIYRANRQLNVPGRLVGKHVPSCGPIAKTVEGNALLVGDAAGHVIAVSGGGIPIAMICGRIAGRTAAHAALRGGKLTDYETEWRAQVAKPLARAVTTKRMASFFFGSDRRLQFSMSLLGARRMGRIVRCRLPFP